MVYKTISSQAIIAKTKRDLRVTRDDWINDAVEWIGEALDAIGTPGQLVDKAAIAKTASHQVALPPSLYLLKGVYYGHGNSDKLIADLTLEDFPYFMKYGEEDLHPSIADEKAEESDSAQYLTNETYLINNDYIYTSFESDYILMIYKEFPLDDDGFPMVPDMYEFSQAMYWYIVMKLMEGGEKHPAGLNYFHAEERWLKYCGQARAQSNMPDIGKAAAFRDMWVRLVPQWNRDFLDRTRDAISLEDFKSGLVQTRPTTVEPSDSADDPEAQFRELESGPTL